MHEWGSHARKLLIQKVNIYDRCPSLDIVLVAILDCYTDVTSNRNQDGVIPWDSVYLWCGFHGVKDSDREFYLDVIKRIDSKVTEWQRATSNSGNTPPKRQQP